MKRIATLLFLFLLIFTMFTACQNSQNDFKKPVSFYYCNNLDSKDDFENVFVAEPHESYGYEDNKPALLSLYLAGPNSERLISPFPDGIRLISVQKEETTLQIVLSDEMATLAGLDLVLACTCLAKTVFELYPCNRVAIAAETKQLDSQNFITFHKDSSVLTDNAYPLVID